MENKILDFWNERAALGVTSGTQDLIAKELELNAIEKYIQDGTKILEIGCGTGLAAIRLAKSYHVDITAIDFSPAMISEAKKNLHSEKLVGSVEFIIGDHTFLKNCTSEYDIVYSERALINIPDFSTQAKTIESILNSLRHNGIYIMCEGNEDALKNINALRSIAGLPTISMPWHNRYFSNNELDGLKFENGHIESIDNFASTYYFLSRIINASLAHQRGELPEYNSEINQLALILPPFGEYSQTKIWLWRKI